METREFWRNIYGYKGLYQVSNKGRVRSCKYNKVRILKMGKNNKGYLYVNLCANGGYRSFSVHRLVASIFVNGDKSLTVNHRDGNKENNIPSNLEWVTMEQNQKHFIENHIEKISGENNGKSVLKKEDIQIIRQLFDENDCHSARSLSFRFNVSKQRIRKIVKTKIG